MPREAAGDGSSRPSTPRGALQQQPLLVPSQRLSLLVGEYEPLGTPGGDAGASMSPFSSVLPPLDDELRCEGVWRGVDVMPRLVPL